LPPSKKGRVGGGGGGERWLGGTQKNIKVSLFSKGEKGWARIGKSPSIAESAKKRGCD